MLDRGFHRVDKRPCGDRKLESTRKSRGDMLGLEIGGTGLKEIDRINESPCVTEGETEANTIGGEIQIKRQPTDPTCET